MSYATQKVTIGRKPTLIAECDLDSCRYEYGKSYTNLLWPSEDFTSWSTTGNIVVTGNSITAPDGTLTADKIGDQDTVNPSLVYKSITITAGTEYYTCSIYLKAGSSSICTFNPYFNGASEYNSNIDLTNGKVTSGTAEIEYIGNGWYRVWIVIVDSTGTFTTILHRIWPLNRGDASGTGYIYAWGAQIVKGNKPGHYVKTITASATAGCNATDAKANLLLYSEQFDNAAWVKSNTTVTPNTAIDPDGLLTADLIEATVSGNQYIYQTYATTSHANKTYTFSVWLKNDDLADSRIKLRIRDGANTEIGQSIVSITSEWVRYFVTATFGAAPASNIIVFIDPFTASGNAGLGYFTWGAQLVEASIPGIYYKTEATAFSGTVGSECYNTRNNVSDCQDPTNFNKILKTYRFGLQNSDLPKGINIYPCITEIPDLAPVGAPVYGLGDKGKVKLSLQDFTDTDRLTDPYVDGRTYTPQNQGTFWGKFIVRNPYYIGRELRIKPGFITSPWDWDNFETRNYIIDRIIGPSSNEKVNIEATDRLRLTDSNFAEVPARTIGTYSSGLTSSPITIVISTSDPTEYDSSGYVRIKDEIYAYTGKTTPSPEDGTITLTGISRQQWGTSAVTPSVGDSVQMCKAWESVNVIDIVYELLNTYAGIDASYIPYTNGSPQDEWDIEKENWLSGNNLTTILHEPESIKDLLEELAEENQFGLFVDQINDKIKLITNTPPLANEAVIDINDMSNFIKGSLDIKDDIKNHFTRIAISYDKINYTENDDIDNFHVTYIDPDLTIEGGDFYNRKNIKHIKSRWFNENNGPQVTQLSGRLKARFRNPPKVAKFSLDAKDSDIWTGDLVNITTRILQGVDGSSNETRFQILSVDEEIDKYKYIAMASQFYGTYAFIAPNGLNDYSSESEANKQRYAFICPNSGVFDDGTLGYKII